MSLLYFINPSVFHEKIAQHLAKANDEELKSMLLEFESLQGNINSACRKRDIIELRIMGKVGMTMKDFIDKVEKF